MLTTISHISMFLAVNRSSLAMNRLNLNSYKI